MPAPSDSPLSGRVRALAPSATLAALGRVRALRDQGVEVLDLTAGEPDFPPPPAAEEGARRAIAEHRGRYTPAPGIPELRAAVAERLGRDFGLDYAPEEVVVTEGAKLGICQALLCLVDPGDEVLFPAPYWTSYPEMVKLAEGVPVPVPCGADLLPDPAAFERARTPRTKVVLLNTPNNPTGRVYPKELLAELGAWAERHGLCVVSDEIYAALCYGGAEHHSPLAVAPGLRERSFWVGGMSKAYAMTGWRMGFLAASAPLASALARLQSQLASSPNAISQYASLAALRGADADVARMREHFAQRRDLVVAGLRELPGVTCPEPEGAFYAFPNVSAHLGRRDPETGRTVATVDDLAALLLDADRVAVVAGSAFGSPDAIRLSFANSEQVLTEALRRIGARLAALT